MNLFTIGYGGAPWSSLEESLVRAGVEVVFDVRLTQGVSLAWVSQVLDERHRPLQRARRAQGKKVSDPWVNIWVTRVDGE